MQFNSAKSFSPRRKSHWQTLVLILAFLLLALVIWKWFDYQIARLSFPPPERVTGMLTETSSTQSYMIKSLRND